MKNKEETCFFLGTRRTPPLKIPLSKTPTWKIPPCHIPPWWIPPRKTPPRKALPYLLMHSYTSFIKNEAWTCHRIKFSFACFLKFFASLCFDNLFKLWICWNFCKYRLGTFNSLWILLYHLYLFSQIDAFKGALEKLLVLIKKIEFFRIIILSLL